MTNPLFAFLPILQAYNACTPSQDYVRRANARTFADLWAMCSISSYMAWIVSVFVDGETPCEDNWPGGFPGPDWITLADGTKVEISGRILDEGACAKIRAQYPADVIERAIVARVLRDGRQDALRSAA